MKISVITVSFNSEDSIRDTIESVVSQDYADLEYIIVDGASTDNTLEIIKSYGEKISKFVSESDHGIYDALNKGIKLVSGDIIAILHADDLYADKQVLSKVVRAFFEQEVEAVYGDLVYVNNTDVDKISRYWQAGTVDRKKIRNGWMPPHPAFFVRKHLYRDYGAFESKYRIAGDYDFMMRVLWQHRVPSFYLPEVLVKMRLGGVSNRSLSLILRKSREDLEVIRKYRIGGILTLLKKNFRKLPQFLVRKGRV